MSSITSADSDPDHQESWVDELTADSNAYSAVLTECVAAHRYGWNLQLLLEQAQRTAVLAAATAATKCVPRKLVESAQRDLSGLPAAAITLSLAFCMHRRGRGGRQSGPDPRLDPNIDPARAERILANRRSAAVCKVQTKLGQLADAALKAGMLSAAAAAAAIARAGGPSAVVERARRDPHGITTRKSCLDTHLAAVGALAATWVQGTAAAAGAAGAAAVAAGDTLSSGAAAAAAANTAVAAWGCGSTGADTAGASSSPCAVVAGAGACSGAPGTDAAGFEGTAGFARSCSPAAAAAADRSSSPDGPPAAPSCNAFNTDPMAQHHQDAASASGASDQCALPRVASFLAGSDDSPQLQQQQQQLLLAVQPQLLPPMLLTPSQQLAMGAQAASCTVSAGEVQAYNAPSSGTTFMQLHRASSAPQKMQLAPSLDHSFLQQVQQMQSDVQLEYDLLAAEAAAAAANGFRQDAAAAAAAAAALAAAGSRLQTAPYAAQPSSTWSASGWPGGADASIALGGLGALPPAAAAAAAASASMGSSASTAASASIGSAAARRRGPARSVTFSSLSSQDAALTRPTGAQSQYAPLGTVAMNVALGLKPDAVGPAASTRRLPARSANFSTSAWPTSHSSSGSCPQEVTHVRRAPFRSLSFTSSAGTAAASGTLGVAAAAAGVRKGPRKAASKTRLVGMPEAPSEAAALYTDPNTATQQQQQQQQQWLYQAALASTWCPSVDAVASMPCDGHSGGAPYALQPQTSWSSVAGAAAGAAAAGALPGAAAALTPAALLPGGSYMFGPSLPDAAAAGQYSSGPGAAAGAAFAPLQGFSSHMGLSPHVVAPMGLLAGAGAAAAGGAADAGSAVSTAAAFGSTKVLTPPVFDPLGVQTSSQGAGHLPQLQGGGWQVAHNAAAAMDSPFQQQQQLQQQQEQYAQVLAAWQQQEEQLLLDMAQTAISHIARHSPAAADAASGASQSPSVPAAAAAAAAAGLVQAAAAGLLPSGTPPPAAAAMPDPMDVCSSGHASDTSRGVQVDTPSPRYVPAAAAAAAAAAPQQLVQAAAHARQAPGHDVYTWLASGPPGSVAAAPPVALDLELELELVLTSAAAAVRASGPRTSCHSDSQGAASMDQVGGWTAGGVPPQACTAAAAVQDTTGEPQTQEDVELWEALLGGVPDPLNIRDTTPAGIDEPLSWGLFDIQDDLMNVLMEH